VVPAAEAVHFHLLLGGSEAELEAELASGGLPFSCEYYHQVCVCVWWGGMVGVDTAAAAA
jgi:hypothetical protein